VGALVACLSPAARCLTTPSAVNGTNSFVDYRVGVETPGKYHIVLNSDEKRFGGHDRVAMDSEYFTTPFGWNGRANYLQVGGIPVSSTPYPQLTTGARFVIQVYLPSRTVLVLGL
jgi:hypothetical protein